MKTVLKPLGLAAAVAAVTAGYAGVTQAQIANNGLGDAAIIPYYTVAEDFVTGVHIINTSDLTQVVKLRMRRGSDSMDALDFNIILSPYDEWTGFINGEEGSVAMNTDDTSCTAPLRADGVFPMPSGYAEGASEGYIEIIGMGSAPVTSPIGIASKHTAEGVPFDCASAESNFFRNAVTVGSGDPTKKGVLSNALTHQTCTDAIATILAGGVPTTCLTGPGPVLPTTYGPTDDVLKVSYFHRDAESGLEFGNGAVMLAGFGTVPMMTNQEAIVVGQEDDYGYLFPDLDGGSPGDAPRGRYNDFVRPALGASAIVNDWSVASARNVSTDWVVTLPGQYIMLDLLRYTVSLVPGSTVTCLPSILANAAVPAEPICDARDLPVTLGIDVWDREEQTFANPEGGLVISPSTTVTSTDTLVNEVNVIQWNDGINPPVLPSQYAKSYDVSALGSEAGWASLSVSSSVAKAPQGVFNFASPQPTPVAPATYFTPVDTANGVPIVGYVAWERSFPSDPSANYGRIVEHSYASSGD